MYRDASNYKVYGVAVFAGQIRATEVAAVSAFLKEDQFIPEQVGLDNPRTKLSSHFDDDHLWCELVGFDQTFSAPTDMRDIHDFVDVDHRNRLEFDAFGKRPDVSIPPSVSDDLKQ